MNLQVKKFARTARTTLPDKGLLSLHFRSVAYYDCSMVVVYADEEEQGNIFGAHDFSQVDLTVGLIQAFATRLSSAAT